MSLGIVIKAPEGIVLAAESRVTLTSTLSTPFGLQTIFNNFDNASKVFSFNHPNNFVGVVTYGQAVLGNFRTVQSYMPELESTLKQKYDKRLTVLEIANEIKEFFLIQWQNNMPQNSNSQSITFNVAGFDDDEPYGKVFTFDIPKSPNPIEKNCKSANNLTQFGITWGGQREIVDRMIYGFDSRLNLILDEAGIDSKKLEEIKKKLLLLTLQTPIQFMPLQDCVNLAQLFIRTTIETQKLTLGLRGCGGEIDISTITKNEGFKFVQEKHLTANN